MRRLAVLIALLPLPAWAQIQKWEKLVVPGLTYRMEIDYAAPRVVHILRWSPSAAKTSARAETAGKPMLAPKAVDASQGRAKVSAMVARDNALAGINGDFFPWQGNPLGCMVRDGELVAPPHPARSCFGWGPGGTFVSDLTFRGLVQLPSGDTMSLDGLNSEAGDNSMVLQTATAGYALSKGPATHILFEAPQKLGPIGLLKGKVVGVVHDKPYVVIGPGQAVLTVTGSKVAKATTAKVGDEITVSVGVEGFDWNKVDNVIGGGPLLVKGGRPSVDPLKEKFGEQFSTVRHPRTAVGSNKDGDIFFVVVDGRQAMSRGATLAEMADLMVQIGCDQAINLDGGGSSTMVVGGVVMNRPSDGNERAVANGIVVGTAVAATDVQMVLKGTRSLENGKSSVYTVIDESGQTVPDGEVLWSAQGAGWIDQSGTLRGFKPGRCTIRAYVRGKIVTGEVTIE
ncbi:MAG: phosphodiester glycosidase family protein [Fimbriimonadaceae bacterium]|nr:phosphodiester glycosidase family protein [Fimbriimonadaceae bacterium]